MPDSVPTKREWETTLVAWCPKINAPATQCDRDGCTHYMVDRPLKEGEDG